MNDTHTQLNEQENLLKIYTLGRFVVRRGDTVISDKANRSYRLWELFKYLLTNRNKSFLPESIAENLWPDSDFAQPRQAIRTQVCRLRKLLMNEKENTEYVSFVQGCYQWDNRLNFWLDVDEFEHLYRLAKSKEEENYLQAMEYYRDALALYHGEYLPGSTFNEWVIPVRNYYRNLFLQCVADFAELLQTYNRHAEIVDLCEKAVLIEPYEEELHLKFMEALLAEGKVKKARIHYEYITSLLYREFGIKPSPEMLATYRKIQLKSAVIDTELAALQDEITDEKETDGAFSCNPDVFRSIYKLERRRSDRMKQNVYFGSLSPAESGRRLPGHLKTKAMEELQGLLIHTLRKGDVVSRWNEHQFVLILPGVDEQQAGVVLRRVEKKFRAAYDIELNKKALPVLPEA